LRFNYKVSKARSYLLPVNGSLFAAYNFFFTFHKLIIAVYLPFKVAFEQEPTWGAVYFDFYLDVVFFIEILM